MRREFDPKIEIWHSAASGRSEEFRLKSFSLQTLALGLPLVTNPLSGGPDGEEVKEVFME